eukprot:6199293-Pleurochrysis_carterae.AAC.7
MQVRREYMFGKASGKAPGKYRESGKFDVTLCFVLFAAALCGLHIVVLRARAALMLGVTPQPLQRQSHDLDLVMRRHVRSQVSGADGARFEPERACGAGVELHVARPSLGEDGAVARRLPNPDDALRLRVGEHDEPRLAFGHGVARRVRGRRTTGVLQRTARDGEQHRHSKPVVGVDAVAVLLAGNLGRDGEARSREESAEGGRVRCLRLAEAQRLEERSAVSSVQPHQLRNAADACYRHAALSCAG